MVQAAAKDKYMNKKGARRLPFPYSGSGRSLALQNDKARDVAARRRRHRVAEGEIRLRLRRTESLHVMKDAIALEDPVQDCSVHGRGGVSVRADRHVKADGLERWAIQIDRRRCRVYFSGREVARYSRRARRCHKGASQRLPNAQHLLDLQGLAHGIVLAKVDARAADCRRAVGPTTNSIITVTSDDRRSCLWQG